MNNSYDNPGDLPTVLPVFPLRGSILLPRASLTLNVFEPRYLALVDYALANERLIGVVQPGGSTGSAESPQGKSFPIRPVGCVGRITSFNETDDGPLVISLTGISRFLVGDEATSDTPFRLFAADFKPYTDDFISDLGEEDVDRVRLLATLRRYLEANGLNADWERINEAANEQLVNTLSILSPYGPEEKQALLEAASLKERAEALVALAEMELASRDDSSGTSLQ
ncbi:LON peptidase substrate-binding domain-containing protein [Methyloceanibacter sp. wino2]|uniref:LON peptidase substrate-binding domain-containing protein n=1 Tax=Methyloceanibacter sp. wino2 TaxID=2170729 RepID=UPI001FE10F2C|nr:LON peptidase substrate-binding domain-containing protein [Methyloceanibacter sp. wino2]